MNTPLVSVLIPSYNHGKYIHETIQSVLDQTYQNFEIIITDDGSSDNTVEVIRTFQDPRVKLHVFSKNKGASIAYKNCLEMARGIYIACLSSDDIWLPEKLEKQVAFLENNPQYELVFTTAKIIDEDGAPLKDTNHFYYSVFEKENRSRHDWLKHFFFEGNCLCHPSVLARRGLYERFQIEEMRLRQLPDFNVWIKICLEKEIYIIQENLLKFRVRANELNASGNTALNHSICSFEMLILLNNYKNISSLSELSRILPITTPSPIFHSEKDIVIFQLGVIALTRMTSKAHRFFGASILYELFLKYGESFDYMIGDISLSQLQVQMGTADCFNIIQNLNLEKDVKQYTKEIENLREQVRSQEERWSSFTRWPLAKLLLFVYSKLQTGVSK